jgi:homoserine kinase type II
MFPLTARPTTVQASGDLAAREVGTSLPWQGLRQAETPAIVGHEEMARREMETVLRYWGYRPQIWRIVGFTAPTAGWSYAEAMGVHPIVEVLQATVIVRRQTPGLSERAAAARHAFMQHLAARSLPVPPLVCRPDGSTYAFVPIVPLSDPEGPRGRIYAIEHAIYEVQEYVPGRRFMTGGPWEDVDLVTAARTLAELHRASLEYNGPVPASTHGLTTRGLVEAHLQRIGDAAQQGGIARPLAAGLRRLVREGRRSVAAAAAALDAQTTLPSLYLHSDYQPHNLAFIEDRVAAIYDFEAMHGERRVVGLAYALLAFTGLRWGEEAASGRSTSTPPLEEQGLDLDRARTFLAAYGQVVAPAAGEAEALGDALQLVFPIIVANGAAEDLVYADSEQHRAHSLRECRAHLAWAETFPSWIEEHRAALCDAWQQGGRTS